MFLEQLKIEFKVYLRQPLYLIFSVFMPLISFAIFGSIYGHMNYGNVDFFSQYIPSFCVIILFSSSVYNVGNQVVSDKEKGIYKRLRVTPIKLWKIILALVLKAMIISMISYILIILFAVFYFKISMPNLITFSVIYAFAVIYSLILGVGLGIIINRINTYSGY
nr:ABC transporter permease [Lactobacillus johnsonii]